MSLKPEGCKACPLYSGTMVSGAGVRPAKVVFLDAAAPSWAAVPMADRGGKLVRYLIDEVKAAEGPSSPFAKMASGLYYMYTLGCGCNSVTVDLIRGCRDIVTATRLLQTCADVVVALGPHALTFLGIKEKITEVRGSVIDIDFYGKKLKVLPSFSTSQLLANPGLADTAKRDYLKAAEVCEGKPLDNIDMPQLLAGYCIPKSLDDAISVCEEYSSYTAESKTVANSLMSLDFETTSLFAWNPTARIIALSAAVAPGKAMCLFVDHKDSPYKFHEIAPWVMKVLGSAHPKTWWNFKYDLGMAKYALCRQLEEAAASNPGFRERVEQVCGRSFEEILSTPIVNTRWDGMLAEHMLEEEKTGQYSLKVVVGEHYPSLIGYESALHSQLTAKETEFKDNILLGVNEPKVRTGVPGFRYLVEDVGTFPHAEEMESITAQEKALKALRRKKQTTPEQKVAIEKALGMLDKRKSNLKKAISAAKKMFEKYSGIFTGMSSNPDTEVVTFEDVDPEIMLPYAAIDADLTWRISQAQRLRAWKEDPPAVAAKAGRGQMYKLMDLHYIPLTEALSEMQVEGVRMDRKYLTDSYNDLYDKAIALEAEILATIKLDLGMDVPAETLNNSTALANLMIAGYGLPKIKSTDSGEASADKDVMEEWAKSGNPVATKITLYRAMTRGRTTYLRNLLDLSEYDGRVHGSIHANGTATGRLSSSNPNLQNQPPEIAGVKIKAAFIPTDTSASATPWDRMLCHKYSWPQDELMCIVDMDFAGAEVRGLTTYAKDQALLDALNSGLDMHSWVASMCFGETYEAINEARNVPKVQQTSEHKRLTTLRKHAKAVVFGIIFCISPQKLSTELDITVEEAEKLMGTFFSRFPNIEKYISTTKATVAKEGILRTPTGRARRFPMAAYGGSLGAASARQGVNFLVQGFTSEIVSRVLINCRAHMSEIRARMLMTVHDSLVFEMPVRDLPKLESFLERYVRDFIRTTFHQVPVEVPYDVEVGPSYGEAKNTIMGYYAKMESNLV